MTSAEPLVVSRASLLRFARTAAGAALALAILGLAYNLFALEAGAAVCALIGLVASFTSRDLYAGAGCAIAVVISFAAPVTAATINQLLAARAAASQADELKLQAQLAEVEDFDARMRAYKPDLADANQFLDRYRHLTQMMTQVSVKIENERLFNSNDAANLYNQLIQAFNLEQNQHSQISTIRTQAYQKYSRLPAQWSHVQSLCKQARLRDSDACRRSQGDYNQHMILAQRALTLMDTLDADYDRERAAQQDIIDKLQG